MSLHVRLLGPPRIERDGVRVAVDTRKAIGLLAYLADRDAPVSRSTLMTLLWPDYPVQRAQANLRRTLWSLNRIFNSESSIGRVKSLAVEQDQIMLRRDGDLWLDTWRFHALMKGVRKHAGECACAECVTRLEEAARLARGDFLEGFTLDDSADFDDWQALQSANWRNARRDALRRLVAAHRCAGTFAAALTWAEEWCAADPLHEPAHRELLLLYAWNDQHAAALRHYREIERLLREEFGVSPEAETTQLFEAIKARREPPPPLSAATSVLDVPAQPSDAQIRIGALPLSSAGNATEMGAAETVTRFVAREAEIARLARDLDLALAGQERIAFVVGEAGQGKTALLRAFARHAQAEHDSLIVLCGECNAYTGVGDPYLPFRQALEMLIGIGAPFSLTQARRLEPLLPAVSHALATAAPDLVGTYLPAEALLEQVGRSAAHRGAPRFAHLEQIAVARRHTAADATLQQTVLFDQVARLLRSVTQHAPLLLLLDDVQWADQGSIHLLFHLSRSLTDQPLLIVGAYRPGEVAAGRQGERHPLEPVLHEIQRRYGDIKVDLAQSGGRAFIDALLDSEPNQLDESFRATLLQQTGGHALFTTELLRGMQERGDLTRNEQGQWISRPMLDWETLPARVEGVIAERIGRLPQAQQELLRAAAIQGEEFIAEVAAAALGSDEREAVRLLSAHLDRNYHLVSSQGVVRHGDYRLSRYRFHHFLLQRYLVNTLDDAERAYLSESVAVELERRYAGRLDEIAVQLARLFQDAGLLEKALDYLQAAGNRALRLSAHDEAIQHFRHGLALLPQLPDSTQRLEREFALQIGLSTPAQITQGFSTPIAKRAFDRAIELGRTLHKSHELVQIISRASHLHISRGELTTAQALAQESLRLALELEDDDLLLQANTVAAVDHLFLGNFVQAGHYLEQAFSLYNYERHTALTYLYGQDPGVHAGLYLAIVRLFLGYPEEARARMNEAVALARKTQHAHTLAFALSFDALLYTLMGVPAAVLASSEEAMGMMGRNQYPQFLSLSLLLRGWALAQLGQIEEGMQSFADSLQMALNIHVQLLVPFGLSLLSEIHMAAGNSEDALIWLSTGLDLAAGTQEAFTLSYSLSVKAELMLAQGAPWAEAEAVFREAVEIARRQSNKWLELRSLVRYATMALRHAPELAQRAALRALEVAYISFSEGFDLPDMQAAAELLGRSTGKIAGQST